MCMQELTYSPNPFTFHVGQHNQLHICIAHAISRVEALPKPYLSLT